MSADQRGGLEVRAVAPARAERHPGTAPRGFDCYARIDLCIVGGFTEAKKIASWCETHYIKLAVHNSLGPVSSAACLHLNLACPNIGVQEQPQRTNTILTDVVPVQPEWDDGYLLPPTRLGLGIEFDRTAAK
jgi:L-alanine-DL-glutamate epimerase-like enolase superfamily enzyme